MKHLLLPALLAASLMGCGQTELEAFWARYDYISQQMARKVTQRDALPLGDPNRVTLENQIQGHRETVENIVFTALDRGIVITTPEGTLDARTVGGEIRITLTPTPVASPASIGALAPSQATTRPEARP